MWKIHESLRDDLCVLLREIDFFIGEIEKVSCVLFFVTPNVGQRRDGDDKVSNLEHLDTKSVSFF